MPHSRSALVILSVALAAVATSSVSAGGIADDGPPALRRVLDCRALTDDRARLACFDAGVAQLDEARAKGEVAIVDREEVKRTRRGLFGFSLPSLAIFGGGKGDPRKEAERDELKEITGKVRAVARNSDGGWIVTLEDGARWEQTDSVIMGLSPKPGATATIKRAAFGSYKMSIGGGVVVRARRIG